jgi:predicted PurR-regulated permease PerM
MVDTLTKFFEHRSIKRILALVLFVTALVVLQDLATLYIFYLIFGRGFGWLASRLSVRTPISEKAWAFILVLAIVGGITGAVYSGVHRSLPFVHRFSASYQDRVQELHESSLFKALEARHLSLEKYSEQVKHFSERLMRSARGAGRALLHLVLGLILGLLYILERRDVEALAGAVPRGTVLRYLIDFFGYASEAILLTVQVQVIVALVNAATTLPILIFLGLPHIPTLFLMVLAFGLIPVIGNFLSGAVLSILSYLKMGWLGVGIFVVSTVVLHKVESYYLNPRLTARHVKLPSLLLIGSLIVWEHLIGLSGVFVSFPALYVALRIRDQFRAERTAASSPSALAPVTPVPPSPAQAGPST